MENLTNVDNAAAEAKEIEALAEADLFADELDDHFNNMAAGTSSFSSISTSGCICTAGCFCTL